jgi:uncharacterized protein
MKRKKFQYSFFTAIFLILFFMIGCTGPRESDKYVYIGDAHVAVDVANTEDMRMRGLGGKSELCEKCGMIFVFDSRDQHRFWMKDMLFDIDIIWIDGNRIVDISEHIDHTRGENAHFEPSVPVDHVLEVPAGFVGENGIYVGQMVKYAPQLFE